MRAMSFQLLCSELRFLRDNDDSEGEMNSREFENYYIDVVA